MAPHDTNDSKLDLRLPSAPLGDSVLVMLRLAVRGAHSERDTDAKHELAHLRDAAVADGVLPSDPLADVEQGRPRAEETAIVPA